MEFELAGLDESIAELQKPSASPQERIMALRSLQFHLKEMKAAEARAKRRGGGDSSSAEKVRALNRLVTDNVLTVMMSQGGAGFSGNVQQQQMLKTECLVFLSSVLQQDAFTSFRDSNIQQMEVALRNRTTATNKSSSSSGSGKVGAKSVHSSSSSSNSSSGIQQPQSDSPPQPSMVAKSAQRNSGKMQVEGAASQTALPMSSSVPNGLSVDAASQLGAPASAEKATRKKRLGSSTAGFLSKLATLRAPSEMKTELKPRTAIFFGDQPLENPAFEAAGAGAGAGGGGGGGGDASQQPNVQHDSGGSGSGNSSSGSGNSSSGNRKSGRMDFNNPSHNSTEHKAKAKAGDDFHWQQSDDQLGYRKPKMWYDPNSPTICIYI
jgi:hypothetical protein